MGIFLTVDSIKFDHREADARNNGNALPSPLTPANYENSSSHTPLTRLEQSGANKESNSRRKKITAAWESKYHAALDWNTETIFDLDTLWEDIYWLSSIINSAS